MDHFISMYIDNELSLDEKILFLEHTYANRAYKDDAVSLLELEKSLSAALNQPAPDVPLHLSRLSLSSRSLGLAVAACLLLVFSFLAGTNFTHKIEPSVQSASVPSAPAQHRFVIFQQGTEQVEIAGSFTNWQRVPLVPTGSEGYWEITLQVPSGEHRYSFIVDGSELLPDPTVAAQESDDFGTINSVLNLEV